MKYLFSLYKVLSVMVAIVVQSNVSTSMNSETRKGKGLLQSRSFQFEWGTVNVSEPTKSRDESRKLEFRELIRNFTDFEDDTYLNSWIDRSPTSTKWKIEDCTSLWEPNSQISCQNSYSKRFIRVDHGEPRSFGVAVLSTPDFLLSATQILHVTLSYLINSKWDGFNSLQIYVIANGVRYPLFLIYYPFYVHREWTSASLGISPAYEDTTVSIEIYAFCGINDGDTIAIDNIFVDLIWPTNPDET